MTELEKWAECSADHAVIEDFWNYISRIHDVGDINIRSVLADYYGIDRVKLDLERRALLMELRRP